MTDTEKALLAAIGALLVQLGKIALSHDIDSPFAPPLASAINRVESLRGKIG